MSMDGRTRVRHAIERQELDRLPRFDSPWEDTLALWRQQGLPADVEPEDYFDWDIRLMGIDVSMRCEQKVVADDGEYVTVADRYGYTVRKAKGKARALGFTNQVTTDKDAWQRLRPRFTFDPNDRSRIDRASYFLHVADYPTWAESKQQFDSLRAAGKYINFHAYGPWEGIWRHRGHAQLLMDIALDPSWVREMGETQIDLLIECLAHAIKLGMEPDGMFLIDDLACTRGTLFSPASWQAIYQPAYRRLGAFLRDNDIAFWLHCCGNCETLIPYFLDCGLQVLNPLQAHAGMDIRKLTSEYGADLTFYGNIDAVKMSAPDAVCEQEVRDKIEFAWQHGGYIYHSDHSIPPEVTFPRYQWIMELVQRYGSR